MSDTLLLRLAAPMQSWGDSSKFQKRITRREPTKSGVIGMIAAALGRERQESVEDLCHLKFGVRIDQTGKVQREYQIARKWLPQEKTYSNKEDGSFLSTRYFLHDAVFLVGLEGDMKLLEKIETALQNPVFPIGLGRRACIPELPLIKGIRNMQLLDALVAEPWHAKKWYKLKKQQESSIWLEIMYDATFAEDDSFEIQDVPVSYLQENRVYDLRSVVDKVKGVKVDNEYSTYHDPLSFALDAIDAIDKEEVDVHI
jgi:CRISPR system Cascade subunit CasD